MVLHRACEEIVWEDVSGGSLQEGYQVQVKDYQSIQQEGRAVAHVRAGSASM